ncbi:MAG: sensor histidine kinase [Candidatus Sericytochromatia bacterium]
MYLPLVLLLLCLLPIGLQMMGVETGLMPVSGLDHGLGQERLYRLMSGAFLHTMMEWSGFCLSVFIGILALSHYRMNGNLLIMTIGSCLLFSGLLDAVHALVADGFLGAEALNQDLIPLTWTVGRLFNSLVMASSVLYLLRSGRLYGRSLRGTVLLLSGAGLVSVGFFVILFLAHRQHLPQSTFSPPLLGLITRPYDLLPLGIYLLAGTLIYPRFYRRYPSIFSFSLLLSLLPDSFCQLYMALGSRAIFDVYFQSAHLLKILAYAIPLLGLLQNYLETYRSQGRLVAALQLQIQERQRLEREVLEISHREQERIGKDLHDSLGQQLTGAALLCEGLSRQLEAPAQTKATQITRLLNDAVSQIRNLSRLLAPIELQAGDLPAALRELAFRTEEVYGVSCSLSLETSWPEIPRDLALHLYRIAQEATHNSIRHSQGTRVEILLAADALYWKLEIRDNGRGLLAGQSSQGLGLKLMHSRAHSLGATLLIEPAPGSGTRIRCFLPRSAISTLR